MCSSPTPYPTPTQPSGNKMLNVEAVWRFSLARHKVCWILKCKFFFSNTWATHLICCPLGSTSLYTNVYFWNLMWARLQGNMNHTESTAILLYSQCCQVEFYIKEACWECDQEGPVRALLTFILRLPEFGVVCKEKKIQTRSLKLVVYLLKYLAPKCSFQHA